MTNNIENTSNIDNEVKIVSSKFAAFRGHKKTIFALLVVVVGFLLVGLLAYPFYKNYTLAKETLATKNAEAKELDLRISQLETIKRLVATIEQNTNLTEQAVPNDDDIPVVMAAIQKIAQSSGVKIVSFNYAGLAKSADSTVATTPNGENDAFKLNIMIRGKYDNLQKFLENVENSRRLLDASNFSYGVTKSETEIIGNTYELRLLLTAYYKSFNPKAIEINLDKYSDVVQQLEQMIYYDVDLTDTNIGKIDPFSTVQDKSPTPAVTPTPENANTSGFFDDSNSTSAAPLSTQTGVDISVVEPVQDVEAEEGDVTKILQELLKQEGVN